MNQIYNAQKSKLLYTSEFFDHLLNVKRKRNKWSMKAEVHWPKINNDVFAPDEEMDQCFYHALRWSQMQSEILK